MTVERFIKLKIALRKLQQQVKDAELEILDQMQPGESFRTQLGTVSVGVRKSWQYPEAIKREIRAIQQDAQLFGKAKQVETTFVRYDKPKNL